MANTYPYVSSSGPLLAMIAQLRKSFPATVTTETLQKLGIAPNNETYVINVMRFLGWIDAEGKKVTEKTKHFLGTDEAFAAGMAQTVEAAYRELFDLHKDAWVLDKTKLTAFFRTSDESSDLVGGRQAATFLTLGQLSGKTPGQPVAAGTTPRANRNGAVSPKVPRSRQGSGASTTAPSSGPQGAQGSSALDVGLNVRIELNLPATDDPKVYDAIFKSIREHLLNGRRA